MKYTKLQSEFLTDLLSMIQLHFEEHENWTEWDKFEIVRYQGNFHTMLPTPFYPLTTEEVTRAINNFLEQKSKLEVLIKEYIWDKTNPLEDRWQMFIESGLGKTRTYIPNDFTTLLNSELLKDLTLKNLLQSNFNLYTHEEVCYSMLLGFDEDSNFFNSKEEFKEYMMSNFMVAFVL